MGNPRGFMQYQRGGPKRRPAELRIHDWREVYLPFSDQDLTAQAARCMDCGIPFCHQGCPLGNLIPEWNDLIYRNEWKEAIARLHATNNFPEFTGRLCPAPCESACVLGIPSDPVSIKLIEQETIEHAFAKGLVNPVTPSVATGFRVAVVGSGPAGLAAAQQLTRAGHAVTVYEKADRIGGLMRYGIPEFKLEKRILDRRLAQMESEGTVFVTGVEIGRDIDAAEVADHFDAVLLAIGSEKPRDLPVPGRELAGVHQAMEYLPWANRVQQGDLEAPPINANGKHVVVIGGGDTGADCVGTAHRQGALSVTQIEILPRPGDDRPAGQPWPTYPAIFRVSSAHEEGGERMFSLNTEAFVSDGEGRVAALNVHEVVARDGGFAKLDGSEIRLGADLVLLAMGFVGVAAESAVAQLGLELTPRGSILAGDDWVTSRNGVFACGDARRGQSLIVWAIAEGRSAAAAVDRYLTGGSDLPAPIATTSAPMAL
ncbi:MAG: glutamate synthase subunit beta [Actinomycetota bacterium]|nr:glutamate synthase subunit beta [Actinomycetota bacterium]